MHHAAAPRGLGADICRDGGAAERARFEIVLGSDVYQGSNPCLCAKKKSWLLPTLFFGAETGISIKRAPAKDCAARFCGKRSCTRAKRAVCDSKLSKRQGLRRRVSAPRKGNGLLPTLFFALRQGFLLKGLPQKIAQQDFVGRWAARGAKIRASGGRSNFVKQFSSNNARLSQNDGRNSPEPRAEQRASRKA